MRFALGLAVIAAGLAVVIASDRIARGGEENRTKIFGRSPESGNPRARRVYYRAVAIAVGSGWVVYGVLVLVGVVDPWSSHHITVGPVFVTVFLVVWVLAAIYMAVAFLRRHK